MSYLATRPSTSSMQDASHTITLVESEPLEEVPSGDETVGTLHLRGAPRAGSRNSQRVVWREDVVDNERAGKKSSKICCIYHKPKRFDESSSEESSSDSDSDSDSSCDSCNVPHHGAGRQRRPNRPPPDTNGAGPSNTRSRDGPAVVHELHDDGDEPNAYEKQGGKKPQKPKNIGKPIPKSQH